MVDAFDVFLAASSGNVQSGIPDVYDVHRSVDLDDNGNSDINQDNMMCVRVVDNAQVCIRM